MTVGERIYYCRTENHMTQKELGEKTGIDPSTIRKYESGRLNPKISTLQKIADALGCSVADLDEDLASSVMIDPAAMDAVKAAINYVASQNTATSTAIAELLQSSQAALNPSIQNVLAAATAAYQATSHNKPVSKEEQLLQHFRTLNDDGQTVAVDRVEELAQIPKYQRPADSPQDAPAGSDDKTPAEK